MNVVIQYSLEGTGTIGDLLLAIALLVGILLSIFVIGSIFDRVF